MKDILALAISLDHDEPALKAAAALAHRLDAHAAALVVAVHLGSHFAAESAPLSEVLADFAKGARAHAVLERAKIGDWLARAPRPFELRDVVAEDAVFGREIIAETLCADLVVLCRTAEDGDMRARRALLEHVLFGAGRPVLLTPAGWRRERWDRIVIGWNARREARRAVAEALPLLKAADQVVIATVDARPSPTGHGEAPGRELATHLARHGVKAEVQNVDGIGRTEARALTDLAVAVDADLMVIGAYGHSRTREVVFGGVTRDLLSEAPVPLFLAH